MKTFRTMVILTACLFVFLLSACARNGPPVASTTQTTGLIILPTQSVQTPATEYYDINPIQNYDFFKDMSNVERWTHTAHYFLRRLVARDAAALVELLCDPEAKNAFDFLEDLQFGGYEMTHIKEGDYSIVVTVRLSIVKGNDGLFKAGDRTYRFLINDWEGIIDFYPADRWEESRMDTNAASFCHHLATYLPLFETIDDFITIVPAAGDEDDLRGFGWGLMSVLHIALDEDDHYNEDGYMAFPRQTLLRQTQRILGITTFDVRYCGDEYNAENDTVLVAGHGGHGYIHTTLLTTLDDITGEYTVVINYSSDSAGLSLAKTIKYTLRPLEDGVFRLLSTEKLYDNGQPLYWTGH